VRHRISTRRLGLPTDQRIALLRSLVTSLLWRGYVVTTQARAKEARPLAERLITLAKTDSLHHRRLAARFLLPVGLKYSDQLPGGRGLGTRQTAVKNLFEHVGPQYQDRPGGYARLLRLGRRRGDAAQMARLELVDFRART
jgi:large subunit ribosomal protein L17